MLLCTVPLTLYSVSDYSLNEKSSSIVVKRHPHKRQVFISITVAGVSSRLSPLVYSYKFT